MKYIKKDYEISKIYEGLTFTNIDSCNTKCKVTVVLSNQFSIIDFQNKYFKGRKIVSNQKIFDKKVLFVNYFKKEKGSWKKTRNIREF